MRIEDFKEYLKEENYIIPKEIFENVFKTTKSNITEKGVKILQTMQENKTLYNNIFNAKILGELLFMAPRSVSGSIKKLVADGYVEKLGSNPISYKLTKLGEECKLDNA
jgi:Mn-dependent DtxR family transcriptional regulator